MGTNTLHDRLAEECLEWQVSDSALKQLRESMPNIIATVNAKFRLDAIGADNKNIIQSLDFLMDAHTHFGEMLLAIYQFRIWHELLDEAMWYAQSIRGRSLYERYFSKMIKTFMISMFSYIKPPDVNELIQPLNWLSNHVHELFELKTEEIPISDQVSQLAALLFANDRNEAEELINSFYDAQKSEEVVIDRIITPVLVDIGKRWSENKITVADEHLVTASLRSVYHALFKSHYVGTKWDQEIIVCCVPGEEHEIGAELLSLYLQNKGWHTKFIGHSTPEGEIIRTLEQNPPFAAVLSIKLISHLPALDSLARKLREKFPKIKIIAGGVGSQQAREIISKVADAMPESFEKCNVILENMVKSYA